VDTSCYLILTIGSDRQVTEILKLNERDSLEVVLGDINQCHNYYLYLLFMELVDD